MLDRIDISSSHLLSNIMFETSLEWSITWLAIIESDWCLYWSMYHHIWKTGQIKRYFHIKMCSLVSVYPIFFFFEDVIETMTIKMIILNISID